MTLSERVASMSAAAVGRLLLGGEIDPVALLDLYLERIEAVRDQPVFLEMLTERARREAEASARRHRAGRPLGPLDGVPVAWKDLFDVAGSRTTAGSALYRDSAPKQRDAPCVANLAAAGMVALGKVNLTEFAFSGLGLNPHFGTPANPHDSVRPRVPGGSSSGSGVAVAMGLAPCAIGSDTGGSVRVPAAFNGVVGYKSSERRIDKSGVYPLSDTLDTVGPLARSVEDCVLLDAALRGAVTSPVRLSDLSGLRLLVAETVFLDDLDDAVGANFEAALATLSAAGAHVERRQLPLLDEMVAVTRRHGSLITAEAYHLHHERVDGPEAERIDRRVVARIRLGKAMSAHDLLAVQGARRRLAAQLTEALDGLTVYIPAESRNMQGPR